MNIHRVPRKETAWCNLTFLQEISQFVELHHYADEVTCRYFSYCYNLLKFNMLETDARLQHWQIRNMKIFIHQKW